MFERFVLISEIPATHGFELWSVTDLQTHLRGEMELYPAVALTVPAWTETLKRSATTASQLQHPHLARLLDLRVTAQYTAAIWCSEAGLDLTAIIREDAEGRVPFNRAIGWLEQLAGAIDHLHATTGTAHGALSPRRVRLAPNGSVQVVHSFVINTLREIVMLSGGKWESGDELPYLSPQRWEGLPVS